MGATATATSTTAGSPRTALALGVGDSFGNTLIGTYPSMTVHRGRQNTLVLCGSAMVKGDETGQRRRSEWLNEGQKTPPTTLQYHSDLLKRCTPLTNTFQSGFKIETKRIWISVRCTLPS